MAASALPTAGIVVWRRVDNGTGVEIFLVHPGGPFWSKKDEHAWSIPKGELEDGEPPVEGAIREFAEEVGRQVPEGELVALEPFRAGKKQLHAFTVEGDLNAALVRPDDTHRSMVELEWPPRSGERQLFPEVDRAMWCDLGEARGKLHKGQGPLVEQLTGALLGE